MKNAFDTKLFICGEFKRPRQMLGNQTYEGHSSIHDSDTAENLGFSGAPIEGPTHFSQFVPLLYEIFGQAWFETGCISSHFMNMVVEGEEVRAFVSIPKQGDNKCTIRAEKRDGTIVLSGTASIGPDHPESELDKRRARLKTSDQLVILSDVTIGMKHTLSQPTQMDFDQHMGALYPFTLDEKLKVITEPSPWYSRENGPASPWGRAVIPLEMVSVLTHYQNYRKAMPVKGPSVGLFVDLEVKFHKGPLFVGQPYRIEREVVALSESRRVESIWLLSSIYDLESEELLAESVLNSSVLKDSYKNYQKEAKILGKKV